MRRLFVALFVLAAACRGEAPPRDYQNSPPAMTHPPHSKAQTPSAQGLPPAAPEPSTAVEGKTTKPVDPVPPANKMKDQPPVTKT